MIRESISVGLWGLQTRELTIGLHGLQKNCQKPLEPIAFMFEHYASGERKNRAARRKHLKIDSEGEGSDNDGIPASTRRGPLQSKYNAQRSSPVGFEVRPLSTFKIR